MTPEWMEDKMKEHPPTYAKFTRSGKVIPFELTPENVSRMAAEVETGQVSDGYHTFDELYDHRVTLFLGYLAVLKSYQEKMAKISGAAGYKYKSRFDMWYATHHYDVAGYPGWLLIVCMDTKTGEQISYHVPEGYGALLSEIGLTHHMSSPVKFDGHTSADVLERLKKWMTEL